MITLEKIPAMLRATRAALNMNQDEFAKMVGLSSPTIARLEEAPGRVRASTYLLLNPIIKKALANDISPEEMASIKAVNRISDFDDIFTAPRHGYRSNNHYYYSASALPHLINVTRPLLLISAKDDPFLGFTATENDVSDTVTILDTEHGGHVGFIRYRTSKDKSTPLYTQSRFDINWLPETVCAYFKHIGVPSAA